MIARELNIIDSEPTSEPLMTKVIRRMPESPISPRRTSSITDVSKYDNFQIRSRKIENLLK